MTLKINKNLWLLFTAATACQADSAGRAEVLTSEFLTSGTIGLTEQRIDTSAVDTGSWNTSGATTTTDSTTSEGFVGCGNGEVELDEDCDDGNLGAFDGCSTTCKNEFLIFVTQEKFGVAQVQNAAQHCQNAATTAGFYGQYTALVSTSFADAKDSLQSRRYILPTGEVVFVGPEIAATWEISPPQIGLAPQTAVAITEIQNLAGEDWLAWTGTSTDGVAAQTCNDWSSATVEATLGKPTSSDSKEWIDFTSLTCNVAAHLYCVRLE